MYHCGFNLWNREFAPFFSRLTLYQRLFWLECQSSCDTSVVRTAPICCGVLVADSILSFCIVFCRSLFVLFFFFFWSLYCLSFNLRFLITTLVSSTFLKDIFIVFKRQCILIDQSVHSNPAQERCTPYNIIEYSLSVTCGRSVVFPGTPVCSTNETEWPLPYNWNSV